MAKLASGGIATLVAPVAAAGGGDEVVFAARVREQIEPIFEMNAKSRIARHCRGGPDGTGVRYRRPFSSPQNRRVP